MDVGGRRQRRIWRTVGWCGGIVVAASVIYTVLQLRRGGLGPSDTAGLWGLPVGLAALLVSVLALRKPEEGNTAVLAREWAATLAAQIAAGEGRVHHQLLGDDTKSIDLRFTLRPAAGRTASAPPAGRLLPGSALSTGLLLPASLAVGVPDVAEYWRTSRPRRLVITGPAGSGKTVTALVLILALIKDRAESDPVPVRISLVEWDTTTELDALLTERLVHAYGWTRERAAILVGHGLVLPVLDGLDEMDPMLDDGTPDPDAPRARAVLNRLDHYQLQGEPGPVVLTCRTAHLDALAARGSLRDAARVDLAPVPPADAVAYLGDRAADPARWRPLTDRLTANPTGTLAALLSTPWRLCLTATVYHRSGNPGELTTHTTEQALDDHLLARFIPAATTLHPRTYTTEQVHRWLHHLTGALAPTPVTTAPGPAEAGTDLVLHELWPLAGRTRVRVIDATLTAGTVLLTLPLAWTTPESAVAAAVIGLLAVTTARGTATAHPTPPLHLKLSMTAAPGRALAVGLRGGLAVGLMGALAGALVGALVGALRGTLIGGLKTGSAIGLVLGLMSGLAEGLAGMTRWQFPEEARPWGLLRGDLVFQATLGLVLGLVYAEVAESEFGWTFVLALGPAGLTVALAGAAARRYAVFLLCSGGRLPFRLVVFMDWACEAGLLRYAGPAYQFRHRELQHWLTLHPDPVDPPPGP
ncbi:NACHT domain-containing protein [Streptomyces sp. NPDC059468]|uniref:NACHT domain-containing protein n=1 Tax=Streptomyces sp. NPDC059468 TaxID=3346845 RepID=UPI0036786DA5